MSPSLSPAPVPASAWPPPSTGPPRRRVVLVGRDPERLARRRRPGTAPPAGTHPPSYRADFTRLDDVASWREQLRHRTPRSTCWPTTPAASSAADHHRGRLRADHPGQPPAPVPAHAPAARAAARRPGGQDRVRRAHGWARSTRATSPLPAATGRCGLRHEQAGEHPVRRRGGPALAGHLSASASTPAWCAPGSAPAPLIGRCSLIAAVAGHPGEGRRHAGLAGDRRQPNELRPGGYYVKRTLKPAAPRRRSATGGAAVGRELAAVGSDGPELAGRVATALSGANRARTLPLADPVQAERPSVSRAAGVGRGGSASDPPGGGSVARRRRAVGGSPAIGRPRGPPVGRADGVEPLAGQLRGDLLPLLAAGSTRVTAAAQVTTRPPWSPRSVTSPRPGGRPGPAHRARSRRRARRRTRRTRQADAPGREPGHGRLLRRLLDQRMHAIDNA